MTRRVIGAESIQLFETLQGAGVHFFHSREAAAMSGKTVNAAVLALEGLIQAGRVVRLKQGLYALQPMDGSQINKLAIGLELAGGNDDYIGYASAMELHRMKALEGGPVSVVLKSESRIRRRNVMGVEYQFMKHPVLAPRLLTRRARTIERPKDWMVLEMEVGTDGPGKEMQREKVRVSDPEWTIVSGLGRPDLCGGVAAIARGMVLRREDLRIERLVSYARLVSNRTAARRLGYLLEVLGMQTEKSALSLSFSVFDSYGRLDPTLPGREHWYPKWRLDVNVKVSEDIGY